MAANKDKLLESAQKSLKKKQFARAIKDFSKVVEIDPSDVRSRQKLAELLVKSGRNAEAYEHFESVAKYFSTNGFFLKAIAIYKQMQRLDSSDVSLYNRLAELNEKQGLVGNAMAEYRNLVSHYERNGMIADVIKILEKMRDLDAANLNVRVKLAEIYANNERPEDGLEEFESVLATLSEKNDFDKILKLYKMFMPLFPDSQKLKMGLALTLYEKGELQQGISVIIGLLQEKPENPDLLRVLARGYVEITDWPNAIKTYLQLLALDSDDLETRELYISALINNDQFEQALTELEEWKDRFFKSDRLDQLKQHYETLKGQLTDNKAILHTLDSIYEITGEGDKLLDIMSEKEAEATEIQLEETLSDSILASAEEDIEMPTIELDMLIEEEDDLLSAAPEEELDLQLETLDEDGGSEGSVIELDLSDADELDLADDELELSFDLPLDEDDSLAPAAGQHDIGSQLEEAEFYIQQGLYAEAEKVCTDILTYAPGSEECQKKLNIILAHLNQEEQETGDVVQNLDVELLVEDEDEFFTALGDDADEQKVFRTDVDEQIAADDMESHYNLGIAYREMGLLDDAISEFGKAEKDPTRYVDCQTLKGLCFADKGDFASAELMYQQALDSQHLEDEQRLSLSYELAGLYEASERLEEALSSYQVVLSQDDSYRDVKEKVSTLQGLLGIVAEEEVVTKERISFL